MVFEGGPSGSAQGHTQRHRDGTPAITGLSDLADVERRDQRSIGGAHALGNIAATALFGLSYVMRRRGRRGAGVALSLAGTGAATIAGFLGGDMAYRRGIGVDRTAFDDPTRDWTPVIAERDLVAGAPKRALAGRTELMLYRRRDSSIVSLANRCSHRGGPLYKGTVNDDAVTCPWHRSAFRLSDGAILCGPATAPQPSYQVRVNDGMIEVRSRSRPGEQGGAGEDD